MAKCSIGTTTSGKSIQIDPNAWRRQNIETDFADYLDRDAFDALSAFEYLILRETRRKCSDRIWLGALDGTRNYFLNFLGDQKIAVLKAQLGIDSAFAARDYGRSLLHRHFRD